MTLAIAAALLVAFVVIEHVSTHPLMPFRIFANRNRTGAYLIMLFLAAALFTTFYLMAQYLQDVHGWSPFHTGLGFLPMPVTIMFMSLVVVRRLIPTIGIRPFLTVGPILAIAAMVSFARLGATSSYWQFLGCILVLGLGMGCSFVPLTMTAVNGVAPHETGLASALLNTGQQVGGAIGLAVFGTVFAHASATRAKRDRPSGRHPGGPDRHLRRRAAPGLRRGDRGDGAGPGRLPRAHPGPEGTPAGPDSHTGPGGVTARSMTTEVHPDRPAAIDWAYTRRE